MNGPIWRTRLGGRFMISTAALAVLRSFEQHAPDSTEAGGILLVRCIPNGAADDFIVDEVTIPGPDDVRSRFGFARRCPSHVLAINDAWRRSGGTRVALGEWHTHAEPRPRPSDVDMQSWRDALTGWRHEDFRLFFVIVGQESIHVSEGHRNDRSIEPLEPVPNGLRVAA